MKEQSSMRSWSHKPSSQQKQSGAATAATTRRAKHWLGDVVADTQGEQAGKDQEAPRDSTQKAKYENLMVWVPHAIRSRGHRVTGPLRSTAGCGKPDVRGWGSVHRR